MTDAEYIKTIPTLTNKELLEELDYCGYDSYYRTIREPIIEEITKRLKRIAELEKENAELRKVAEFQQSSNMNRYFENKKLKEGLAVGSTFNKALNSMNKNLEEERDKYRNMVFDQKDQLTKAKEHIENLLYYVKQCTCERSNYAEIEKDIKEAEQFLKEEADDKDHD